MKQVAVIILNWNGAKLLKQFLPSVIENTNRNLADIIVADNGSTDDSLEVLRHYFNSVKVIEFSENYGFAEGYNRAIAQCRQYRYTVLLNSDVQCAPQWLEPLYDFMEENPQTAACQPKIRAHWDSSKYEYAGASGGYIDCHGYPYCRGRVFQTVETDHGQYDDITDIFWATGAALFIRTDLYIKAGGLDKDFFAHMEEIDLCWRVLLMGYNIKVIPQSIVYHLGGGSLPASSPRKTYLNFRNNLLLLHKNLPCEDGKRLLLVRRLYDTLAFFAFIAKGEFANAWAIVRAHGDFRRMKRNYEPTATVNLLKTFPNSQHNIVLGYNLFRRKTFTDITKH